MKLNCKQGDLAIVIGPGRHTDKIVRCVRFLGAAPLPPVISGMRDYWEIDRQLSPTHTKTISDSCLRPIRDQPGADETLQWKEVPSPSVLSPKPEKEQA